MAKETEGMGMGKDVVRPYKGMHTDNNAIDQPSGTYRFMLNGVPETESGDGNFVSNEGSNIVITGFPTTYFIIGDKYIGNDTSVVWSVNTASGLSQIGLLNRDNVYVTVVDSSVLGFRIEDQIDAVYRLRRGNERVIYWVDGYNRPRQFNIDRPEEYYSIGLANWLRAGNPPNTFGGEHWDAASFDLIRSYQSVPNFDKVEILGYGQCLPGSYSFAVQYLDDNLNPTEWITTSNPVNIFNDSISRSFHRIRGSRNTQASSQNWNRANKSIKITFTDLDLSFPYYRVAIIEATSNNGKPTRALGSNIISTQSPIFIFSGNDDQLVEVPLSDIALSSEQILAPKHIEQIENRLILSNTKSTQYNWCAFQPFASKISSDLTTEAVVLNSVESQPNQKNPNSSFILRGYMPGEVYSFGIVYLMKDGSTSPVFHIPGKHSSVSNNMAYHEITDSYINLHNCLGNSNYWGIDATNHGLTNTPIRHHKFKTRKDLGLDLITDTNATVSITKETLAFKLDLAPGKFWPLDGAGIPKIIAYTVRYWPNNLSTPTFYTSYVTINDLGHFITFYDDVYLLNFLFGTTLQEFTSSCDLIVNYQPAGNETFVISTMASSYIANTVTGATTSDILGIKFSNVQKPHTDVVGFYIMRNERLDDDKIVIDNVIMGLNSLSQQYITFGLWNLKKINADINTYSNWFWSAEHQFLRKTQDFTHIQVQGEYFEAAKTLGPKSWSGTGVVGGPTEGIRGVLIQDVYPGTSYNKDVHKKKASDDDGFSLAIGYRDMLMVYTPSTATLPNVSNIYYLDACTSRQESASTFYNASCDNKIAMVDYTSPINLSYFGAGTVTSKLLYATLYNDNSESYADFLIRPYYKEHNNPVLFGGSSTINNHRVFNGDAYISPANLVSTVFWFQRIAGRDKKDRTWQIVVGAVLIVVGVVLAIFTAGAGLAVSAVGLTVIAGLAISYGVSLAMSGIKFEQMKNMIDNDYPKGLKDSIKDQDTVYCMDGDGNYPGPLAPHGNDLNGGTDDDMFMWWSDRISGIWVESTIPFELRSGLTSGTPDFIDAPNYNFDEAEFQNYLTEKLTVIDRDRGSGRLYKGYPTSEIYDINMDFIRYNKEKEYIHLPAEYDCCFTDGGAEVHSMRNWYSEQSFQEELIDNYRVFLPNNYRDIEGEHGEITDLYRLGNNLYIHTKEALWHLPQNVQERVTNDVVSFIGTGSFFSIPPRKMLDDNLGSAGTQHKWSSIKTGRGVFFISEIENKVYLHGETISELGELGIRNDLENTLKSFLSQQLFVALGVSFKLDNNPANPNGIGYIANHDTRHRRILFTKKDYLITAAKLSVLTYTDTQITIGTVITSGAALPFFIYSGYDGYFYEGTVTFDTGTGLYTTIRRRVNLSEPAFFENKSFTISFDIKENNWIGYHSYIPDYYIHNQSFFYSSKAFYDQFTGFSTNIYKHNEEGNYQTFYDSYYPFILETISTNSPLVTKVYNGIQIQTKARKYDNTLKEWWDIDDVTFNRIVLWNTRQATDMLDLTVKSTEGNPAQYMHHQVVSRAGEILIDRVENNWNINDIRDYRINYNSPIWKKDWASIQPTYWIDKVLNSTSISVTKSWTELQLFRDKYIAARFIFDDVGFNDISLTANYVIFTEEQSAR